MNFNALIYTKGNKITPNFDLTLKDINDQSKGIRQRTRTEPSHFEWKLPVLLNQVNLSELYKALDNSCYLGD